MAGSTPGLDKRQANGAGPNTYIRSTGIDPDPWDAGAIDSILPELANPEIDWSKSLAEFSRDEMIAFLGDAYNLISKAMIARDKGENLVTRRAPASTAEAERGLGRSEFRSEISPMPDFNRTEISALPVNVAINALIEEGARVEPERTRGYLGASASEISARAAIQYDWMCDPEHSLRLRDIFDRGHFFEAQSRDRFIQAGFKFAETDRLKFEALDGMAARSCRRHLRRWPENSRRGISVCLGTQGRQ